MLRVRGMLLFSLQDIAFRPRTVLIFMTIELWDECTSSQGERAGKKTKKKEVSVLRNCLPPECRVLYSITNGIIGDFCFILFLFFNSKC